MTDVVAVNVQILGKDYKLSCPPEERDGLVRAAELLDERMRALKAGGMIGLERIAVMAALNLGFDLLQARQSAQADAGAGARVDRLLAQVDEELQAYELVNERSRHNP
jgi:cell division protein ZapA